MFPPRTQPTALGLHRRVVTAPTDIAHKEGDPGRSGNEDDQVAAVPPVIELRARPRFRLLITTSKPSKGIRVILAV